MTENKPLDTESPSQEKLLHAANGFAVLLLDLILSLAAIAAIVLGAIALGGQAATRGPAVGAVLLACGIIWLALPSWVLLCGIKVLKPNEALVLTLFGRYVGTLKSEGIYFVNPFCTAVNPTAEAVNSELGKAETEAAAKGKVVLHSTRMSKKISLKTMTLNNEKQKINDLLGNPIIIGIAVIWRVSDTAKAVFQVDNYREFLSIQCDSALRNIVLLYPYDTAEEGSDERSLRGSSQEISENLKQEIASRVAPAGLEILEARITHLAYAPEIAAVMLQRQQASAVIDARKMIVEGAVGMVEMALEKLSENQIVELDEERKAQMVSNLMVVLCSSKDAQPVVNSGTLY